MDQAAYTLGELFDRPDLLAAPEQIGYIAWRNKFTLFGAREKTGKSSFMGMDAIRCVSLGYRVLWICCEEDMSQVAIRFDNILNFQPEQVQEASLANVFVFQPSLNPNLLIITQDLIRKIKPDIVYIDTFSSFLSLSQKNIPEPHANVEWQKLTSEFKKLAENGNCAIVVLSHNNKSKNEIIGSVGVTAASDVNIVFTKEGKNLRKATCESRFRVVKELWFQWNEDEWNYTYLPERGKEEETKDERNRIVELLKKNGPMKRKELIKTLQISPQALYYWIKQSDNILSRKINAREREYYLKEEIKDSNGAQTDETSPREAS